jgi:hypothetical protein
MRTTRLPIVLALSLASSPLFAQVVVAPPPVKNMPKANVLKPLVIDNVELSGPEVTASGKTVKVPRGELTGKPVDNGKGPVELVIELPSKPGTTTVKTPAGAIKLEFVAGKSGELELKPTPDFPYSVAIANGGKVDKKLDKQAAGAACDPRPWMGTGIKAEPGKLESPATPAERRLTIRYVREVPNVVSISGATWSWTITPAGGSPKMADGFGISSTTAFSLVASAR